jgi:hypothetical protein
MWKNLDKDFLKENKGKILKILSKIPYSKNVKTALNVSDL